MICIHLQSISPCPFVYTISEISFRNFAHILFSPRNYSLSCTETFLVEKVSSRNWANIIIRDIVIIFKEIVQIGLLQHVAIQIKRSESSSCMETIVYEGYSSFGTTEVNVLSHFCSFVCCIHLLRCRICHLLNERDEQIDERRLRQSEWGMCDKSNCQFY